MRTRHVLAGLAATTALALVGSAVPVSAAVDFQPVTDVTWVCDGGAYITVWLETEDGEPYDVHIGGEVWENVEDGSYGEGPFDDGFVNVTVLDAGGDVVFETDVLVGCNEPGVDVNLVCDEDGGHLLINIADDTKWAYSVYVDDVDTPLAGWVDVSDTDGSYEDLGAFAEGTHTVYVSWSEDDGNGFYFQQAIEIDCDGLGSGGAIPDTGSDSGRLMLVAAAMVLAGAGLMAARRVRSA